MLSLSLSTIREVIGLARSAEQAYLRAHPNRPICSDLSGFPEPSPRTPEENAYRDCLDSRTHDELIELQALNWVGGEWTAEDRFSQVLAERLAYARRNDDHIVGYLLSKDLSADLERALSLLETRWERHLQGAPCRATR
jgi:hypothetical protein